MEPAEQFRRRMVAEYYKEHRVLLPPDFAQRDFMFERWEGPPPIRYKAFQSEDSVARWLAENAPPKAYYSVCCWERPHKREGRLYSNVAFDIDVDKYANRPCLSSHPQEFICDDCLKLAMGEVGKLVDMLTGDAGLRERELLITFSGSRGGHVRVFNKDYDVLGADARRALVGYLQGEGVLARSLGFAPVRRGGRWSWTGPGPRYSGWRGRSCRAVAEALAAWTEGDLTDAKAVGVTERQGRVLAAEGGARATAAKAGEWARALPGGMRGWEVEKVVAKACERYAPKLDVKVTINLVAQFRIPRSIHGGSGLIVKVVDAEKLGQFNPILEASPVPADATKVKLTKDLPRTKLGGAEVGGKRGDELELDGRVASYLVFRGFAAPS